jgi:type II secretory pathway predicted ATPase ExeA
VIYAPQFGLKKKPFPLLPAGPEVFVGPQAATLISTLRDACDPSDAVITVSGSSGTGKTTLVRRALQQTGLRRRTVTIDGEPLQAGDVLESLLTLFGCSDLPDGKDAQLATWHQLLRELKEADAHVFIVIENALLTGADVIAELTTISTASDQLPGARMIIMGDEHLEQLLESPELAQCRQRVSLQHTLSPFCEAEIRGYLRHSLRAAGGDFGAIFDEDCITLLLQLSEGIPRTVNAIVETVLAAATERQVHPISAKLVAEVAAKAYDPARDRFDFSTPDSAGAETNPTTCADAGVTNGGTDPVQMPDLDALARAISVANGKGDTPPPLADSEAASASCAEQSLTLSDTARERAISFGMDSAEASFVATNIAAEPLADAKEDLELIARRLADARTLNDIDDAMAETLFGNDLDEIAAIVTGKKQARPAANDQAASPRTSKQSLS